MMNKPRIYITLSGVIMLSGFNATFAASNIDASQKYAWSTNAGWINFRPTHGGVTVYPDHLEGLAWAENIGWVQLGTHNGGGGHTYANTSNTDWGVNNDGAGKLSGYARSLDGSWINFNPAHSQVTINMTTGEFDGYAWSENVGWIHFNGSPTYQVRAEGLSVEPSPPPPDDSTTPPPPPPSTLGRAIVIAASGAHRGNTLFRYTEEMTRRMYRLLRQRGYTDEDIIYLNPRTWQDINGDGADDGVVDDDLFEPQAAIEAAFNSAASLQPGQQFVFYIQGHGLQNQLKITREYWLNASELRRLVDKVPADVPQVIIIDSCYSGSFLDELRVSDALRPTVQRIVLTSTDADTTAWNALHESFSEKLISELRHGETLKTAFERAESMMAFETKLFGEQRPQLDDDGDGVYTSHDGTRAAIILGNEGGRSADAPEIIDVHEPLFLAEQQTEGMLWVKTSPSGEGIRGVRAILMRPGTQRIDYQGEDTEFNREEVAMSYLQDRYVAVYSHFRQAGTWRVLYQAQGEDGTWSSNRFGEVEASGDFPRVVVTARLNQSAYHFGDYLSFKVDLNAEANQPGPYDIYGAIVFPQGYFVTFAYPMTPSLPGVAQPYRQAVEVSQPKTLSILDLDLPTGLELGSYQACGVVTETGDDPLQSGNWIDIDCAGFELR